MKNLNAFTWETYAVPRATSDGLDGLDGVADGSFFEIRTMKAGRTGARKTWAAAPVLLRYLSQKDGLKDINEKNFDDGSLLDMALETNGYDKLKLCNILELGGGSGFLSVGLAKSLRSSSNQVTKIMCTDSDTTTIKNMRYNVIANNESKTIAIQKLDWSDGIGGDKFASALERMFKDKNAPNVVKEQIIDPISLITHVIGSDVHFGHQTLSPLSSIIVAIKHRNPLAQIIIMLKERSENGVADLVAEIERKLQEGNIDDDDLCKYNEFPVYVRDVVELGVPDLKMKLVEC